MFQEELSDNTSLSFLPHVPLAFILAPSLFLSSPSSQGRGTPWPAHHGAGPETRAPGSLHGPQQHGLLPERTEPQGDPGAGGQLPAPGQVHVCHHHTGKGRVQKQLKENKYIYMCMCVWKQYIQFTVWYMTLYTRSCAYIYPQTHILALFWHIEYLTQ